jgi:hypothetical protein
MALKQAAGKVMKVALSARIPANKVTCRKTGCKAHALSGKAVRAFDLFVSYEKPFPWCTPFCACTYCTCIL